MDSAAIKRAKRIRRQMLGIIDAAKAASWARGRMVADILADLPDGIESDEEVLGFGQDLANAGLIEIRDTRTMKCQRAGIEYVIYQVTAKGTALLMGGVPVEPLVEDERIGG